MTKQFQARLRQLNITWPTGVQVSAMDLIPIYVSLGFGLGLSIAAPGATLADGLKAFPLANFPPLVIAALWQKNLSPSNTAFLEEIKRRAREITPPRQGEPAHRRRSANKRGPQLRH